MEEKSKKGDGSFRSMLWSFKGRGKGGKEKAKNKNSNKGKKTKPERLEESTHEQTKTEAEVMSPAIETGFFTGINNEVEEEGKPKLMDIYSEIAEIVNQKAFVVKIQNDNTNLEDSKRNKTVENIWEVVDQKTKDNPMHELGVEDIMNVVRPRKDIERPRIRSVLIPEGIRVADSFSSGSRPSMDSATGSELTLEFGRDSASTDTGKMYGSAKIKPESKMAGDEGDRGVFGSESKFKGSMMHIKGIIGGWRGRGCEDEQNGTFSESSGRDSRSGENDREYNIESEFIRSIKSGTPKRRSLLHRVSTIESKAKNHSNLGTPDSRLDVWKIGSQSILSAGKGAEPGQSKMGPVEKLCLKYTASTPTMLQLGDKSTEDAPDYVCEQLLTTSRASKAARWGYEGAMFSRIEVNTKNECKNPEREEWLTRIEQNSMAKYKAAEDLIITNVRGLKKLKAAMPRLDSRSEAGSASEGEKGSQKGRLFKHIYSPDGRKAQSGSLDGVEQRINKVGAGNNSNAHNGSLNQTDILSTGVVGVYLAGQEEELGSKAREFLSATTVLSDKVFKRVSISCMDDNDEFRPIPTDCRANDMGLGKMLKIGGIRQIVGDVYTSGEGKKSTGGYAREIIPVGYTANKEKMYIMEKACYVPAKEGVVEVSMDETQVSGNKYNKRTKDRREEAGAEGIDEYNENVVAEVVKLRKYIYSKLKQAKNTSERELISVITELSEFVERGLQIINEEEWSDIEQDQQQNKASEADVLGSGSIDSSETGMNINGSGGDSIRRKKGDGGFRRSEQTAGSETYPIDTERQSGGGNKMGYPPKIMSSSSNSSKLERKVTSRVKRPGGDGIKAVRGMRGHGGKYTNVPYRTYSKYQLNELYRKLGVVLEPQKREKIAQSRDSSLICDYRNSGRRNGSRPVYPTSAAGSATKGVRRRAEMGRCSSSISVGSRNASVNRSIRKKPEQSTTITRNNSFELSDESSRNSFRQKNKPQALTSIKVLSPSPVRMQSTMSPQSGGGRSVDSRWQDGKANERNEIFLLDNLERSGDETEAKFSKKNKGVESEREQEDRSIKLDKEIKPHKIHRAKSRPIGASPLSGKEETIVPIPISRTTTNTSSKSWTRRRTNTMTNTNGSATGGGCTLISIPPQMFYTNRRQNEANVLDYDVKSTGTANNDDSKSHHKSMLGASIVAEDTYYKPTPFLGAVMELVNVIWKVLDAPDRALLGKNYIYAYDNDIVSPSEQQHPQTQTQTQQQHSHQRQTELETGSNTGYLNSKTTNKTRKVCYQTLTESWVNRLQYLGGLWEQSVRGSMNGGEPAWPCRGLFVRSLVTISSLNRIVSWWFAVKNSVGQAVWKEAEKQEMASRSKKQGKEERGLGIEQERERDKEDLGEIDGNKEEKTELTKAMIMDKSTSVLLELSLDGTIRYISPTWERITGTEATQLVEQRISAILGPSDQEVCMMAMRQLVEDQSQTVETHFEVVGKEGQVIYVEARGVLMYEPETRAPSHVVWLLQTGFVGGDYGYYAETMQPEMDIPPVVCRICDNLVDADCFEQHSWICAQSNRVTVQIDLQNEALTNMLTLMEQYKPDSADSMAIHRLTSKICRQVKDCAFGEENLSPSKILHIEAGVEKLSNKIAETKHIIDSTLLSIAQSVVSISSNKIKSIYSLCEIVRQGEKMQHYNENTRAASCGLLGYNDDENETGAAGTKNKEGRITRSGSMMIPSTQQLLNPTMPSITDFVLIKPISKGAYGSVYLAKKRTTGEYFAIKVLKKADMVAKNQVSNIRAERLIMITQINSPFVVQLFFTFQSKNYLYLVMEYLNGGDCASLLKSVGCLPEDWAKSYLAEVVLGLDDLHSRNIVHRDLKPDNLLIDRHGHLKLTDFGLSHLGFLDRRAVTGNSSTTGRLTCIVGTPDYLAPESILGTQFDQAVDWWALGVMCYEFLYGIPPFHDDTPDKVFDNILSAPVVFYDDDIEVSSEAKQFILALLERDPQRRLGSRGIEEVKAHPFFEGINWNTFLNDRSADGTGNGAGNGNDANGDNAGNTNDGNASGSGNIDHGPKFVPETVCEEDTEYFDSRGAKIDSLLLNENEDPCVSSGNFADSDTPFSPICTTQQNTVYQKQQQQQQQQQQEKPPSVFDGSPANQNSANANDSQFGKFLFKNLPVLEHENYKEILKIRRRSTTASMPSQDHIFPHHHHHLHHHPHHHHQPDLYLPKYPSDSITTTTATTTTTTTTTSPLAISTSSHNRKNPENTSFLDDYANTNKFVVGSSASSGSSTSLLNPGSPIDNSVFNSSPTLDSSLHPKKKFPNKEVSLLEMVTTRQLRNSDSSSKPLIHSPSPTFPTLKVSSAHPLPLSPSPSLSPSSFNNTITTTTHATTGTTSPLSISQPTYAPNNYYTSSNCVLVADDNPVTCRILEILLKRVKRKSALVPTSDNSGTDAGNGGSTIGYSTITVHTGADLVRLAMGRTKFPLIIADLHLPIIDGEQVARMIKSTNNPNRTTPIVALCEYSSEIQDSKYLNTASTFGSTHSLTQGLGKSLFDSEIVRPISLEKLQETIDNNLF